MSILCAGEILFDFISKSLNKGLGESEFFEKRPGGSPFNVAVGLARLGTKVSFLTKIAEDPFGKFLLSYIKDCGINTDFLFTSKEFRTTLAFAAVDSEGKAEYEFYRDNAADTQLNLKDIERLDLDKVSIYHFGSIALLNEPTAGSLLNLFEKFVSKNVLTSFDPNVRKSLIKDEKAYNKLVNNIVSKTDILKMSDDDLFYLTGEKNVEKGLKKLDIKKEASVFVTLGSNGSMVYKNGEYKKVPGYKVKVVETVGCGDSFMASVLYNFQNIDRYTFNNLRLEDLEEFAIFANKCAAIVATRQGAANAMPTLSEVLDF